VCARPADTAIMVPSALLTLPSPWSRLDADPRRNLESSTASRAAAVEVLDRCLEAAGQLPEVDPDEAFPEWITVAWGLWNGSFAQIFGTFDRFEVGRVAEAFSKQAPDVDDNLVQRYARSWLRKQALDLAMMAHHWVTESLRDTRDPSALRALQQVLAERWQVDEIRAESLMYTVARLLGSLVECVRSNLRRLRRVSAGHDSRGLREADIRSP
jgi:hypothetical protein